MNKGDIACCGEGVTWHLIIVPVSWTAISPKHLTYEHSHHKCEYVPRAWRPSEELELMSDSLCGVKERLWIKELSLRSFVPFSILPTSDANIAGQNPEMSGRQMREGGEEMIKILTSYPSKCVLYNSCFSSFGNGCSVWYQDCSLFLFGREASSDSS